MPQGTGDHYKCCAIDGIRDGRGNAGTCCTLNKRLSAYLRRKEDAYHGTVDRRMQDVQERGVVSQNFIKIRLAGSGKRRLARSHQGCTSS